MRSRPVHLPPRTHARPPGPTRKLTSRPPGIRFPSAPTRGKGHETQHTGGGEWRRARCRVLVPGRSHRPRGFKQCITHHPKEALHGANPPACLE